MIKLASPTLEQLEEAAKRAYPREVCGFLIGHEEGADGHIDCFAISPNRAADPQQNFSLDPAMHLRLQRELRGSSYAIVGLFHSHPNGSPAMSEIDLRAPAPEPWVWLILALDCKAGPVENAAYRHDRGKGPEKLDLVVA